MGEIHHKLCWLSYVFAFTFSTYSLALTDHFGNSVTRLKQTLITQAHDQSSFFQHLPDNQQLKIYALADGLNAQPWLDPYANYDIRLIERTSIEKHHAQAQVHFQYQQFYQDIPILGSSLDVTLKELQGNYQWMITHSALFDPNELPLFQSQFPFSRQWAIHKVRDNISSDSDLYSVELSIQRIQGKWRRLHVIQLKGIAEQFLIDADTGEYFSEPLASSIAATYDGYLKAKGAYLRHNLRQDRLDTLTLPFALVSSESKNTFTDNNGHFTISGHSQSSLKVTAHLNGKWVKVFNENDPAPPITADLTFDAINTVQFQNTTRSEERTAQIDTYFHISDLHHWLTQRGFKHPKFDQPVEAKTNLTYDPCVALYIQGVLLFHKSGSRRDKQCANMAMDTVIRHEYGHFVDEVFGGMTDLALSEGWGDTLASFSLGVDTIAQDVFGKGTFLRSMNNSQIYDEAEAQDRMLRHKVGQSWSGFAWALRTSLIDKYGLQKGASIAEDLILPALMTNSKDIPRAVIDVYVRDDDDGNLRNKTPHSDLIFEAASKHGLDSYLAELI